MQSKKTFSRSWATTFGLRKPVGPAEHLKAWERRNPSIGETYVAQNRLLTDFEAQNLLNVRSGR